MVRGLDREGFVVGLRRVGSVVIFAVIPVAIVVAVLVSTLKLSTFQYDFHGVLYDGAKAIVNGHDPYRMAFLAHLAAVRHSGGVPMTVFTVPVYPAPALVAAIPLALLPFKLAGSLYALGSIAAMIVGLRLLGVTDWRCYGVAFLTWPLIHSLRLGQINELLVLGLAIIWRWRDRVVVAAAGTAAVVGAIVFLWPIGVFLLVTRRLRAFVLAVAIAVAAMLAAWALIDFAGLTSYPRMLSDLSSIEGPTSVSIASVGLGVGASRVASEALAAVVTLAVLLLAWQFADRPDGERRAFGLVVVAALTSSPLVWPHYLTLIFVPIALLAPTLGWLWLTPLIAYLAPVAQTNGDVWKMLPYVAIEVVVIAALVLWDRPRPTQQPRSEGRREVDELVETPAPGAI